MAEIRLSNGMVTLVDDEDLALASQHRWHASVGRWNTYAVANTVINGKRTMLKLHRLILDAQPGQIVDHRNHDGLDNRRANLRLCTTAQNGANNRPGVGYKGVSWHKARGKWCASICINRKVRHLGLFDDPWEAAQAYNAAALEAWGEFAHLNERIVAELLGGASVTRIRKKAS